jgi:zinc protease
MSRFRFRAGWLLALLALGMAACASTGVSVPPAAVPAEAASEAPATEQVLAPDPEVRVGRLDNGLTYYVRANRRPEKRAELRLVVNAGSLLEEEDQRGLAHFVEHMAFNGTENFAKQEIVDYLESIGMSFGPEVNAYTSYDETVYNLVVPTDNPAVLETGVQILEEWAHHISFAPDEVTKERPVIVEEWRLGRGAEARMQEQQLPVLFRGSRYAERRPIGKLEIIETADAQKLLRFYRDWYRPELMAVVAVGDFDPSTVVELIQRRFGGLQGPQAPRERASYAVPPHEETLYAPATDPEATSSRVGIYVKHPVRIVRTEADYRQELVEAMYNGMLNDRFQELARQPEAPIVAAASLTRRLVRASQVYILLARVRDQRIAAALQLLLTEIQRTRLHGFTASELERQKSRLLTGIEQLYKDRENLESESLADACAANFLDGDPLLSVELEYRLFQEQIPGITLEEVDAVTDGLFSEDNRVVLVNAPAGEKAAVPDRQEVLGLFREVAAGPVAPYEDSVSQAPLLAGAGELPGGRIVDRSSVAEVGVELWRLNNGVRVVLKPTDFKEEQILFTAFSPGGNSLVSDREFVAALTAAAVVSEGGVNGFPATELRKKLAGKEVTVSPWIGELYEGFRGSTRPEDLETLFQMIYLYATEPRRDGEAFAAFRERIKANIENRQASPLAVFFDEVQRTISQGHFRSRPWSLELLQEMSLDASLRVYRDRFADFGDFTFLFVGSFTPAQLEPLVRRYLGSLPAAGRVESWRDTGVNPPRGVVRREVRKGLEPQSRVEILFTGRTDWSLEEQLRLEALKEALDVRLREQVREEAGGSYDVGVEAQLERYPDQEYIVSVGFGCAPDQVERLSSLVFAQIADFRETGPEDKELIKVRELLLREHEQNLRENEYWLGSLQLVYMNDLDPRELLSFDARVEALSRESLRQTALQLLDPENYIRVVLLPEG